MAKDKLPTAEEYVRNDMKLQHLSSYKPSEIFGENAWYEHMREFAKLHVKAALDSCHTTCMLKFNAGESGYLKQEDVELAYPLNNIQ